MNENPWPRSRVTELRDRHSERDALDQLIEIALNILAEAAAMGGEFGWAERLVAEADAVTEATGTQVLQYGALFLRAWQGRGADVSRLSDVTVREATAGGQGTAIEFADHGPSSGRGAAGDVAGGRPTA